MNSLAISILTFVLIVVSIFVGTSLRRALPKQHLEKDSQDIVRLGAGLIATIAGLVLGLLIASAKGSFDVQTAQIKQITADVILIDTLLEQYGPEVLPLRHAIRAQVGPFADRLWQEKETGSGEPFEASANAEALYLAILTLEPKNELQKSVQARAVQVVGDLVQTRLLLFVQTGKSIPVPFLIVLIFWLMIIFASFSLFAELNATVLTFLALFALSASCAMFLILELGHPFSGMMAISSEPLRHALVPLKP
jgi:hypothetical protein